MHRKTDQTKSQNKTQKCHTLSMLARISKTLSTFWSHDLHQVYKKYLCTTSFKINTWPIMTFFVIVVQESLVCPEQLNCLLFFRKILQVSQILWFSASFAYLTLFQFQQWLYDFEIHLFTLRTTEGLIHNYYRKFKRSLMLQKKKTCIKSQGCKLLNRMKMCTFFLFCLHIIIFFSFSTALQKLQKILACFPEDKISSIHTDLQIQSCHLQALNASCFLLEHQWPLFFFFFDVLCLKLKLFIFKFNFKKTIF